MGLARYMCVPLNGAVRSFARLDELLEARGRGGYLWIDLCAPDRPQLDALIEPLGVHPLSVEDCLDDDQVPKVEDFPTNTFILFNGCRYADPDLTVDEVNVVVGSDFLVSIHPDAGDRCPYFGSVDRAMASGLDSVRKGPDFLLHAILDALSDSKFAVIEAIQEELDAAEERVLKEDGGFRPEEVLRLRRHLLALRKSLMHEREVLTRICRRDSPFVTEPAVYHFRDVYDHLAKLFEATEICREMIATLMEIHLSMVNVQVAQIGNRTNSSVRRLTVITTIFMPLTLLAGVGGMSEWSMMTGPENWRIAYPAFLAGMAVIGVTNHYFLRWLETRRP
ncbi:MAG: magnesium transporter CorA family protein [Armatimonadetes bacterium]|nr:magnesium transporter CorA family protein [Armatimonadota bacterium]